MRHDSRQHGFKVECGADRLTNFAQCFQLPDRLHQLPRPCFQFLEQPHVFDSDYRLSRKSLKQLDLPLGERTNLCSSDIDYTNRISFPEHGYTKKGSNTTRTARITIREPAIREPLCLR